jgi:phage recombination protein Bet
MPKNQITTATTTDITTSTPLKQLLDTYLDNVKTASGLPPTEVDKVNFITFCLVNNLNPIKKQAYLLGYDRKKDFKVIGASYSTIVSISGYISIAMQTGLCAGIGQPRFTYISNQLDSCSVTVYRLVKGEKCEFVGTAYYLERVQLTDEYSGGKKTGKMKPNDAWGKQPKTMLEKCAKAAALRNAFPDKLSGVYTEDEMPKADIEIEAKKPNPVEPPKPDPEYISATHLKHLLENVIPLRASQLDCESVKLINHFCTQFKFQTGLQELTIKQGQDLIELLEKTNKEFVPTVPPTTLDDLPSNTGGEDPANGDLGNESIDVEVTDTPPTKSERQTTIEECTNLQILQSLEEGISTEEEQLAFDLKYQEFNK